MTDLELSTECFLNAFRKFASRKSFPKQIISDNVSTYLSAAGELSLQFIHKPEAINDHSHDRSSRSPPYNLYHI